MNKQFLPSFPKFNRKSKSTGRICWKSEPKNSQKEQREVIKTLEKILTPQKTTLKKLTLQNTMRIRRQAQTTGFLSLERILK